MFDINIDNLIPLICFQQRYRFEYCNLDAINLASIA